MTYVNEAHIDRNTYVCVCVCVWEHVRSSS